VLFTSCSTHYTTAYKVETPKGNFYVNDIEVKNDSVFLTEYNGVKVRRIGAFKNNEIVIK